MRTLILVAYNTAARRADLLGLRWSDVDLDGFRFNATGGPCPIVRIANSKGNRRKKVKRPLIIPLYSATTDVLAELRQRPEAITHVRCPLAERATKTDADGRALDDEYVFPVQGFNQPGPQVSKMFADLCIAAGLTDDTGRNRWTLHDLRRKANDDIHRAGASIREQMELTGHRSVAVNVQHYQSADPVRMRELVGNLSGFRGLRIAK